MGVKIYGRSRSASAYAIRDFLHRSDVPFEWIELEKDEQTRAVGVQNVGRAQLPICVFSELSLIIFAPRWQGRWQTQGPWVRCPGPRDSESGLRGDRRSGEGVGVDGLRWLARFPRGC